MTDMWWMAIEPRMSWTRTQMSCCTNIEAYMGILSFSWLEETILEERNEIPVAWGSVFTWEIGSEDLIGLRQLTNRQSVRVALEAKGLLATEVQSEGSCPAARKRCVCAQLLNCIRLFATPWTVVRQAPLSLGFPRQEYRSGLLFPSPGGLPNTEKRYPLPRRENSRRQMSYDITSMWNLKKWFKWTYLQQQK